MRRAVLLACLLVGPACACSSAPVVGPVSPPPSSVAPAWSAAGSPVPVPVTEVAGAAFDGRIYLAGGFAADGSVVTAVQVHDPVTGTWRQGPELPEPVHHAALVAGEGELLLVGGYVGPTFADPTDAVRRLDAAAGRWVDGPRLPAPRAAGAAAFDGTRVVYGGGVGPAGLSGEVLALEGGRWRAVGELSVPREHLGAASDGRGRVWFLGGRTGGLDTNLGTADLAEAGGVRAAGDLPSPRGGVAAFYEPTVGACLVGGERPDATLAAVECLGRDATITRLPDLGVPRHGLAAVVVDGVAHVLAGGPRPGLAVSGAVETLRLR